MSPQKRRLIIYKQLIYDIKMGNSLPSTNYFKSSALSALVYGSIMIELPNDLDLSNPDGRTYNIKCKMTYLGTFRQNQQFMVTLPCTYTDHILKGTTTMTNGQIFSINVTHTTFDGKHIFDGTYASLNPGDSGQLYYQMDMASS